MTAPVPEGYIVTKEELNQIKNDCAFPERFGCDNGCKFWNIDEEIPCTWKGANALMGEVMTHPYNEQSIRQDEREKVLDEVIETWRVWHHAGYERPIQRETVVKLFEELRQEGKVEK